MDTQNIKPLIFWIASHYRIFQLLARKKGIKTSSAYMSLRIGNTKVLTAIEYANELNNILGISLPIEKLFEKITKDEALKYIVASSKNGEN